MQLFLLQIINYIIKNYLFYKNSQYCLNRSYYNLRRESLLSQEECLNYRDKSLNLRQDFNSYKGF